MLLQHVLLLIIIRIRYINLDQRNRQAKVPKYSNRIADVDEEDIALEIFETVTLLFLPISLLHIM